MGAKERGSASVPEAGKSGSASPTKGCFYRSASVALKLSWPRPEGKRFVLRKRKFRSEALPSKQKRGKRFVLLKTVLAKRFVGNSPGPRGSASVSEAGKSGSASSWKKRGFRAKRFVRIEKGEALSAAPARGGALRSVGKGRSASGWGGGEKPAEERTGTGHKKERRSAPLGVGVG